MSLSLLLTLVGAAGCGGEDLSPTGPAATDPSADDSALVTLTIVKPGPDGKPVTTNKTITVKEQRAMIAARERREQGLKSTEVAPGIESVSSALSRDYDCLAESLWMYSGSNRTGDQLCMGGAGVTNLADTCARWEPTASAPTCVLNWAGRVKSIWPGNEPGSLQPFGSGSCYFKCATWNAYGGPANISCGSNGIWLALETWGPDTCWLDDAAYTFNNEFPANVGHDWTEKLDGVASDGVNWYINNKTTIYKVPMARSLDRDLSSFPHVGLLWPGYDHYGDIDYYAGDDRIYVPLEGPAGRAIGTLDSSLNPVGFYTINQDHAAWAAINPADGYLYTSPDFDSVSTINIYNRRHGSFRRSIDLRNIDGSHARVLRVQGGAFSGPTNKLYLVSDARGVPHNYEGGIWGFDLNPAGSAVRSAYMFVNYGDETLIGDLGDELEGLTITDTDNKNFPGIAGQIHLMMVDVNVLTDHVYFKHYRISDVRHL